MEKQIQRDFYLNQLIANKDRSVCKVVTGMRRSGKSYLLFTLFYEWLLDNGVPENRIIKIDLETQKNKPFRDSEKLYSHLKSLFRDKERYYILLDEIQEVNGFEDLVNGLMVDHNCDVYITGSNAKLLSKDINTRFRGRSVQIKVFPLSFLEFYSARQTESENIKDIFDEFMLYGSLPYLNELSARNEKIEYLNSIWETLLYRDIIDRYKIRNEHILDAVFDFLCSNIGSYVNANKIANTLKSNGYKEITDDTVGNYLEYLCESFLFYKVQRYDIRGRHYLKTQNKYYISDLGVRNAKLKFRQIEVTHSLENIIYLELIKQGFIVDIGKNDNREIDFVVRSLDGNQWYIQVAYTLQGEEKLQQETASLKNIKDGYRRIILTMDDDPFENLEGGIKKINVYDFLLGKKSLGTI